MKISQLIREKHEVEHPQSQRTKIRSAILVHVKKIEKFPVAEASLGDGFEFVMAASLVEGLVQKLERKSYHISKFNDMVEACAVGVPVADDWLDVNLQMTIIYQ